MRLSTSRPPAIPACLYLCVCIYTVYLCVCVYIKLSCDWLSYFFSIKNIFNSQPTLVFFILFGSALTESCF